MNWDFNNYYKNKSGGLISKLKLSSEERKALILLRQKVRERIRDVFEEAKKIAKDVKSQHLTLEAIQLEVNKTKMMYLSDKDKYHVSTLIHNMDDDALNDFIALQPRFWTQGSFKYDTLNHPFHPGQEMDIDDGTYLPMTVFESKPRLGYELLLLLVDTSLQSLVAENQGWKFEEKRTCARIKIIDKKTHIDVPMYAIPKDKFQEKQTAADSAHMLKAASMESYSINESYLEAFQLEPENVNLALREQKKRWQISDPKIVEDWFNDSCQRIDNLKLICRFMKAWRDYQWDIGGPTSISLMAAIVNILDKNPQHNNDLSSTMKLVAKQLPAEFRNGLKSPDDTDEKLLFPHEHDHNAREIDILKKMEELSEILSEAENTDTKELALKKINTAFGNRVTDELLIISYQAAPAFKDEPISSDKPVRINKTMVSG